MSNVSSSSQNRAKRWTLVLASVGLGVVLLASVGASRDPDALEVNLTGLDPQQVMLEQQHPEALEAKPSYPKEAPQKGLWSAPRPWPVVSINATLLPNGNVLTWGGGRPTGVASLSDVWDPTTGTHTAVTNPWTDLFCAGQTLLPDGRVLAAGGHYANSDGSERTNLFDSRTNTWSQGPTMNAGRWYPSVITLPNGEALIVGGHDKAAKGKQPAIPNWLPQIFDGSNLRSLSGAKQAVNWHYYPWLQMALDGKPVITGPLPDLATLEVQGTGGWKASGQRDTLERKYGNSVMYQPGKVLIVGGGQSQRTINSALTMDLTDSSQPKVTPSGPMRYPRLYQNSVILPNGQVLAVGGQLKFFNGDKNPVLTSESWDPTTGRWTVRAAQRVMRLYHSTALLLPDGRVLSTGGGAGGHFAPKYSAELYTPWYMFKKDRAELASRPVIQSAPQLVAYGERFPVQASGSSPIKRVTLVRLGATTHAYDSNQRFLELSYSGTRELSVHAPAKPNLAPPGQYMLFVLDAQGVPSVAKIITINTQVMDTANSRPIFDDALAPGWQGASWDSSINLENSKPTRSGRISIAVKHERGWGGFSLRTDPPLETRDLAGLSFWAFGGPKTTTLEVYTQATPEAKANAIKRLTVPANVWTRFNVTLEELGAPAQISRLTFQDGTGTAQATYYLDEIRLIERPSATINSSKPVQAN